MDIGLTEQYNSILIRYKGTTVKPLVHIDLFSGIGGFALAADRVWGKGNITHIFCENEAFPQAILKKHWPEAEIHGDVREFVENAGRGRQLDREHEKQRNIGNERLTRTRNEKRIYLLTGGFPCQPFSNAGRRKGTADDDGNGDALHSGERCDIMGACNGDTTTSVRDAESTRERRQGEDIANPVRQSTKRNGGQEISNGEGNTKGGGVCDENTRFTNDMEGNVSVAERATLPSSQSTTRTAGETRKEGSITVKRGNLSSKTDTRKHTNFSATTATTQSTTSEPALINGERVFLLTGGFPCQPFSNAGRRKGTDDERYLWPAMFDVIRHYRPRWVIAENVAGLVTWNDGLVFETVCADLEKEGYEVQPFIIPAVAVGAPHRRDRVWIVANREDGGCGGGCVERGKQAQCGEAILGRDAWREAWPSVATRLCRAHDGFSDWMDGYINDGVEWAVYEHSKRDGGKALRVLLKAIQSAEVRKKIGRFFTLGNEEVLLPFMCKLEQGVHQKRIHDTGAEASQGKMRELWEQREAGRSPQRRRIVEQLAGKLTDAVPQLPHEVALEIAENWDCLRFTYTASNRQPQEFLGKMRSGSYFRNAALKAAGNAIVPQVAERILSAIKELHGY